MYDPPYTIEEIKKYYPDKAEFLINDPVHRWRAESGIELIHEEPDQKEQVRIWNNWQEMTSRQKKLSDEKSLELFEIDNEAHHDKIMHEVWDRKDNLVSCD